MKRGTIVTCIIITIIIIVLGIIAWDTYEEFTIEKPEADEDQQIINFIQESTDKRNNIVISLEDLSDAISEGTDFDNIYGFIGRMNNGVKALDEYLNVTQVPVKCVVLKTKTTEYANISSDIVSSAKQYLNLASNNKDYSEALSEFDRNIKILNEKNEEINIIIRTEFSDFTFEFDAEKEIEKTDL
jgi:hypothetical protein